MMMNWKIWSLKKSPWVFHVNTGACNNCDIEVVDCLTPKYDVERFGVTLVGSPRHADALLVTGVVTAQTAKLLPLEINVDSGDPVTATLAVTVA